MSVPTGSSFDANFYLSNNKDVKTAAQAAVKTNKTSNVTDFAYDHWLNHGAREARNPNALFNTATYLSDNEDVKRAFETQEKGKALNPLTHYDKYGWQEKRNPGAKAVFDTSYYTAANPAAVSYGNPLAYFLAALSAAAGTASTASLKFPESAYISSATYSDFDFVDYLSRYSDVAKWIMGDEGSVPTNNSSLTLLQKARILYHWFEYGQWEDRTAHTVSNPNDNLADTVSTATATSAPSSTPASTSTSIPSSTPESTPASTQSLEAENLDIGLITASTTYTATKLLHTISYTNPTTSASDIKITINNSIAGQIFVYTGNTALATGVSLTINFDWGWGNFVWNSNARTTNVNITGIGNLVFVSAPGLPQITNVNQTISASDNTRTTDVSALSGDGLSRLALIHKGEYQIDSTKITSGRPFGSMALYNIGANARYLTIQGFGGKKADPDNGLNTDKIVYDLFGYKAAPADKTVYLNLLKSAGGDSPEDLSIINISSKSSNDITTINFYAAHDSNATDSENKYSVTLSTADGDDTGADLVEQKISDINIRGDDGVTIHLKDGVGTKAFNTLDAIEFGGVEFNYTSTFSNHTATVLNGSSTMNFISSHAANDLYGQTFQFGTTAMGTNATGTLAAINTVGKINVSNVAAGSTLVDRFNLSTKIFGITAEQWKPPAATLTSNGGVIAKTTTTTQGVDAYLYVGTAGATANGYDISTNTTVDLSFGKTATGHGHAAIVLLQDTITANKLDIYFTTDNTKFDSSHAMMIGSYAETGAWGTSAGKIFDSSHFHIVA